MGVEKFMCGIIGFSGNDDNYNCNDVMRKMIKNIEHRGPDSSGVYCDDDISMGMCRLSIIGLQDGEQPIYNENNDIVVVFNGEIYNYPEIKEDLLKSGHIFKTHSDTEVLVHAYEEYGDDFIAGLRGMFAFAIYDIPKKRLLIARDHFGIKPLYYYDNDDVFMFGSEIKGFLPHPNFIKEMNESALANYLSFRYSVTCETFFKNVYKLNPGHKLIYENGKIIIERYFEPDFSPCETTLENAVNAIDKAVCESVNTHRKISDVEVGSFLSSGVDSSYVAACFGGRKTFTVGFAHEKYNEISYAENLSEKIGFENYSMKITADEYWKHLPKVQYHMDEPLGDASAVALYFVSKLASRHVKIALSGEGADEFFGGYNVYKEPLDIKSYTWIPHPIRKILGKTASVIPFNIKGKNFLIRGSKSIEERYIGVDYVFNAKERAKLLKIPDNGKSCEEITRPYYEKYKKHDDITKMQLLDIHLWMVGDILLKADKMSMAHSLETRVPFLDKEVFKTASKIPLKYRVNKLSTKYAFRKAASKHLPKNVADKKKLGFPVPVRIWLRQDKYYNIVKKYFTNETAKKYFNENELVKLLNNHKKGISDNYRKIWTVFMFLLWYEQYF